MSYISHLFLLRAFRTVDTTPFFKSGDDRVDMLFRNSWDTQMNHKVCVMFYYIEISSQGCREKISFLQLSNIPNCIVLGLSMVEGQKQPLEVFCKKGFCKFHRKTAVFEFLFSKVAGVRPETFLKRDYSTAVLLWNLRKF